MRLEVEVLHVVCIDGRGESDLIDIRLFSVNLMESR